MSHVIPEDCGSSSGVEELDAARKGDEIALGTMLDAFRRYLMYIAQKELGRNIRPKEDASDVVQETLIKAQAKFANFQGGDRETLRLWLRQILRNTLTDLYRKYERAEMRAASKEVRIDSSSQNVRVNNIIAKDLTPSKIMMDREREDALTKALARLPEDQRRVIDLRSRKHLGYPEISKHMNRSAEAVRLLWIRAVKRLAADLRQEQ